MNFDSIDSPVDCTMLIAFCDPTNFAKACENKSSGEIFDMMSRYYELTGDIIEGAGGRIVKFMGDALFIVFPENSAREGVEALKVLGEKVHAFFNDEGIDSTLHIQAHIGSVTCGRAGTRNEKHFDVFGEEVNRTALLPHGELVLSEELEQYLASLQ